MGALSKKKIESAVATIIAYYHFFDFSTSFTIIYRFFPYRISKKVLQNALKSMVARRKLHFYNDKHNNMNLARFNNPFDILDWTFDLPLYTLPQYSIRIQKQIKKFHITNDKIHAVQPYLRLLYYIPTIQFVGITGSASMGNCKKNDDVDLLIVSRENTLWLTRFIAVVLAKVMGLYGTQICLNLFLSCSNLQMPDNKHTEYIGHELLQMKSVVNKDNTYERILSENRWIHRFFPNSKVKSQKLKIQVKSQKSNVAHHMFYTLQLIDFLFSSIQLPFIRRNKTGFLITPTQLWLFKKDFEKKLNSKKNYLLSNPHRRGRGGI